MKPCGWRICMAKYARSCFNETCSFFGQTTGLQMNYSSDKYWQLAQKRMFQSPWTCLVAFDVLFSFCCLFSLFHSLSITAVKSEAFYWPCPGARSTFISLTNILIFRGNVIEFPWFFLHFSCKCCRGVLRRCQMISRNRTRFA